MAVIPMWKCDRDDSMHDSKKDADAQDKMLELAEEFTVLLEDKLKGVDEKLVEEFGLMLARNKEKVIQACKGRPDALREFDAEADDNVTPIAANK